MNPQDPNLAHLMTAARKLQPLLDQIAFVGGSVTGLLLTDPGASPIRPTLDIDAIVEIGNYPKYVVLQNRLRELGFSESREIICRWISDDVVLDLMPTDPSILGFSNRWYQPALKSATEILLGDLAIHVISGPYFLATKLAAFRGRGKNDYTTSHDLEDIVTVIDGRTEIMDEIRGSDSELVEFLSDEFRALLQDRYFLEALPGHLLPDTGSQQRLPFILDRMRRIADEGQDRAND